MSHEIKEMEKEIHVRDVSTLDVNPDLKDQILIMSEKCIKCKLCQKECAFLRKYGKPKDIADAYDPTTRCIRACLLNAACASSALLFAP
jgi:hypothetical protein